ncbi:dioxygenase [Acetobacter sacchari]|uniref:Dioxygenase n=1 Tax=Acetobacter sacchari TaxID=2661687 RepID=A0ABS3LW53_9PROT|nr:class III extradiol ring-cleavage dioxygenase [Acetobacter sacchari]MBO1360132.1 dioxygenase [Acetobacter sacchari]
MTASTTTPARQPVLFAPHGGGPCFFMDQPVIWDRMAAYLRGLAATLPQRPRAILVVSGHWETERPTVTSSAAPPLIYDYYGFPEHTYHLQYPAPGSPELAAQVRSLLSAAGIANDEDPERGFDHGVFIPFLLAFGDADIPVVELSLREDMSAAEEVRIGAALQSLRDDNVLIVATGMTYHNLRQFRQSDPLSADASQAFDAWLAKAVEAEPEERNAALLRWEAAPGARQCHPREEHLLPLMFAAGAAGADLGKRDYSDVVMGKAMSGFRFG